MYKSRADGIMRGVRVMSGMRVVSGMGGMCGMRGMIERCRRVREEINTSKT